MPKFNKVLPVSLPCSIDNFSVREVLERAMKSNVFNMWLTILVKLVKCGIMLTIKIDGDESIFVTHIKVVSGGGLDPPAVKIQLSEPVVYG